MPINIKIITGYSSDAQGFGDIATVNSISDLLEKLGYRVDIAYIDHIDHLIYDLRTTQCELVWPSLYFVSQYADHIIPEGHEKWVQDILDDFRIPYIGSNAYSMKCMLDKAITTKKLSYSGIQVPWQRVVPIGGNPSECINLPAFVKPRYGSESSGIGEHSVIFERSNLRHCIEKIHKDLCQDALVEEYLPGREFTVLVVGGAGESKYYPIENLVNPIAYDNFAILTKQLKLQGLIDFAIPHDRIEELNFYGSRVVKALKCYDHVRIDIREDENGILKVIDVNGIPGLDATKSRSLVAYNLHSTSPGLQNLVSDIVKSAIARHNLSQD